MKARRVWQLLRHSSIRITMEIWRAACNTASARWSARCDGNVVEDVEVVGNFANQTIVSRRQS